MEKYLLCNKCKRNLSFQDFYFDNKKKQIKKPCKFCCRDRYKKEHKEIEKIKGEEWRDVVGYKGYYQVSNFLRLKSLGKKIETKTGQAINRREVLMKTNVRKDGYVQVRLSKASKRKSFLFHRIIADAFISNPENKPYINHKDGNTLNNSISNLEWCTQKENVIHGFKMGLTVSLFGENHKLSKLSNEKVLSIRRLYSINPNFNRGNVAKKLGVNNACISKIIYRKTWNHI